MQLNKDPKFKVLIQLGLYETAQFIYSQGFFEHTRWPGAMRIVRRRIADAE